MKKPKTLTNYLVIGILPGTSDPIPFTTRTYTISDAERNFKAAHPGYEVIQITVYN